MPTLQGALRLLREPVPEEKKRLMRARWESLEPRWRTLGQGFGQQATRCGATIGVHPRCDFACTGCYLGTEANRVRRIGLDQAFRQLDQLRAWLGPKGNAQITDGEVTLLPGEDLVAILRYAWRIGLIPMVMTHGDTFRRRPGLLERLMTEAGLTEVSIHIDTTQRGRLGYENPHGEEALKPLREKCADMVRLARWRTCLPLRAATTLTITRENLDDVPHVVEWCLWNRDVFGMLSFQPVAQVGRTQKGLPGVTVSELWDRIEGVLARYGVTRRGPGALAFGHPDCTRLELLGVYERAGRSPRLFTILRDGYEADAEMMRAFFQRGLGGLNFLDDTSLERVCRAAGVLLTDPRWVLDPAQNHAFQDHYLDVALDLSHVLFIATANVADTIPAPLLDRMEVIRFDGYTTDEKVAIGRGYLWPRQVERNGLTLDDVTTDDDVLRLVASDYTREAGVRQLERELGTVLRKTATRIGAGHQPKPMVVDSAAVLGALGRPKFYHEAAARTAVPGVATGLAVTGVGGDVLFVETASMAGKGGLVLTGQLGDVMKESARIALTYIQSHAAQLGIDERTFDGREFHVHVPAGAIPKDGPSAGVTMVTALASLLTGRPVKSTVGMTGEVTLQGRVLPIGGLKQKVLAAHAVGLTEVILPERNEPDLDEVPSDVREHMQFHPVKSLDEVLALALEPDALAMVA